VIACRPMKVIWVLAATLAGSLLVAGVVFALAKPKLETALPQLAPHPSSRHNLVARQYGPVIRASSADWFALNHPAYVVDGRLRASTMEKWASAADDRRPWIALSWNELRNVDAIRLAHAGVVESSRFNNRRYALVCLRRSKVVRVYEINNVSVEAVTEHAVQCQQVDQLRIEFNQLSVHERARLYEVEVFGS